MIRPQDPKEVGNAEFSYSFYMPQNYAMRNLAVPEKIEAAVDGMILACLKIQQDISLAIPPGWVIDETALQNIDYGLGDAGNKTVDHEKLFFQTGKIWYKGLDAEGQRVPVPIQEIANTGFFNHVQAFVSTYQFWYQSLKDELGEDPNLISAAVQPRVTAENVEVSQQGSENATDYMYRAYTECMKITARKISCLLKDSVTYGAAAYRKIVDQDTIGLRQFSTDIQFLPTQIEVDKFEAMMNVTMQSNPDLLSFINPFQLTQIAKEDVKMAWAFFNRGQKKMRDWQRETAQQNQQQTIQGQIQSAQAAEQAKGENMEMELQVKAAISDQDGKNKKEEIVLTGVFQLANTIFAPQKVGEGQKAASYQDLPQELQELMRLSIKNIAIPLAMDNAKVMQQASEPPPQEQQQIQQQPQEQAA
jgi:hypothetical protein